MFAHNLPKGGVGHVLVLWLGFSLIIIAHLVLGRNVSLQLL